MTNQIGSNIKLEVYFSRDIALHQTWDLQGQIINI